MTKKDLKSGMIVKTRNGNEYMVFRNFESSLMTDGNVLINVNGDTWCDLRNYEDDLTIDFNHDFDIVTVYVTGCTIDCVNYIHTNDKSKLRLHWKRKEVKELTLAEIEKLLGYPVKIVKE